MQRISVLMGLLAAVTVAVCGAVSGVAPGLMVWRAAVAFLAVWAFQRGLLDAYHRLILVAETAQSPQAE